MNKNNNKENDNFPQESFKEKILEQMKSSKEIPDSSVKSEENDELNTEDKHVDYNIIVDKIPEPNISNDDDMEITENITDDELEVVDNTSKNSEELNDSLLIDDLFNTDNTDFSNSETIVPELTEAENIKKDDALRTYSKRTNEAVNDKGDETSYSASDDLDKISENDNHDQRNDSTMQSHSRRDQKRKQKSIASKIIATISTILLILIVIAGFLGYRFWSTSTMPLDSKNTSYKSVEIPEGSGNKLIGNILEKNGIIKSATVFQYYTKFKSSGNFKSGYYNFSPSMNLDQISDKLIEGGTEKPQDPVLGKVVIPEGYTLEQISDAITINSSSDDKKGKTPFTKDEFLKVISDDNFIKNMKEKYPLLMESLPEKKDVKYQLEGYLFPATYDYSDKTTVESLIEDMIFTMNTNLSPYYDQIKSNDLSVNEVLSLSALVEKEGANDEDRRKIAQVFYNRLNKDMPLQSNIAILYAEGKSGKKTTLKEDATIDTNIDSPYNLYVHTGFGPGPVANPGISAIKAVMNPKANDYLYFVADVTTGEVHYSKTLEEHEEQVQKYVNDQIK
ncbi:hypothetical protein BG261_01000 [Floricoccus tropicus]|uniref:Endolytic murein transglycosylase n=1 Tax=Floricoccus tropicus TaxID=1859473 RepID=A0A1E8GQJ6_9LACT|nr:endolytic transglycosylase MltG [Floricoccus tropicus]OFI50487.1 hypothetical protein BG261_01000 [Floricoccus tropicus]